MYRSHWGKACVLAAGILWTTVAFTESQTIQAYSTEQNIEWDVSGYLNLVFKDSKTEQEIEVDDLSLYLSSHINNWLNPFIEAEFFAVPVWNSKTSSKIADGHFVVERIYNDILIKPGHRLRIGKFLAPIGQWNLVHAAPLVWSIERPTTTTYSFSNYISGFEYGIELDPFTASRLDFYWQPGADINPKPALSHPREYDGTSGLSWTLSDDLDGRSSIDFQYAKVANSSERRTTLSFHKAIYKGEWSFEGQFIHTQISDNNLIPGNWDGGAYIQARLQINTHWDSYSRVERFHFADQNNTTTSWLLGSRYRLGAVGNINIEYANHDVLYGGNRWLLSYNKLFGQ